MANLMTFFFLFEVKQKQKNKIKKILATIEMNQERENTREKLVTSLGVILENNRKSEKGRTLIEL